MFLRIVLLVVGAACVLVGVAFLFSGYGPGRSGRAPVETRIEVPVEARRTVLAAAHAIKKGIPLQKGDVVSKDLKADEHLAPGSLMPGQEQDFIGALSLHGFAAGDTLFVSDFARPCDRLAAELRPGYRATSISLDAAQSVSGLALPGDFVDVILVETFDDKTAVGLRTAGETLLHGVQVLALDQKICSASGLANMVGSESRVPKTVTLEVTEQQAKKLLVASKLGSFQLALQRPDASDDLGASDGLGASAEPTLFAARPNAGPVWASDVSGALDQVLALAATERAVAARVAAEKAAAEKAEA
jgi:pilus assembly protein CpaB